MGTIKPGRPAKYDLDPKGSRRPPEDPCVYRIRDSEGNILKDGETNNLRRRAGEHYRSGAFPKDSTIECMPADGRSTSRTRRVQEQRKINQDNPPLNQSKGGEGRPAKKNKL